MGMDAFNCRTNVTSDARTETRAHSLAEDSAFTSQLCSSQQSQRFLLVFMNYCRKGFSQVFRIFLSLLVNCRMSDFCGVDFAVCVGSSMPGRAYKCTESKCADKSQAFYEIIVALSRSVEPVLGQ